MPKKAKADEAAKGIYLRKKTYWLRHSADGERFFTNLKTRDFAEAVGRANEIRGRRPADKPPKNDWQQAIEAYLKDKAAGRRPPHLAGRRLRKFRPGTADRVRSFLNVFARFTETAGPSRVTMAHLNEYYANRAKNSEAGARSTMNAVQAFLDHVQFLPGRVVYDSERKLESRKALVSVSTVNDWLGKCEKCDLKFVLLCGFQLGLRSSEIKHSRLAWFDLEEGIATVPDQEVQILPNGERHLWQIKDLEQKKIPLSREFIKFLKDRFADSNGDFCLVSRRNSKTGLYDFKRPFAKFVEKQGRGDVTPHTMRHSFITALCNSGNHSVTEIAAMSGDGIETIERNYWKKRVTPGQLDDTLKGVRSSDALKDIQVLLQKLPTSQRIEKLLEEISKNRPDAQSDQTGFEWTNEVSAIHRGLYSVSDTISNIAVFDLFFPDGGVPQDDWDKGKLSTMRARLNLLSELGWIKKSS